VAASGTGAPQGDRSQGVSMVVINTITPATEKTCHYFWANVRDYQIHEQRVTTQIREGVAKIFHQDEVIVEAQQRAMDENPDHVFYNLNIDAGSIWARRIIDRMVAAEAQGAARTSRPPSSGALQGALAVSQTLTALLRLRELILSGALPPGERLSEPSVAERLGASRTPVRAALARLAEEGLVEAIPSGGFAVKAFTEKEIRDAIELRGALEGLAARFAAERGAPPAALAEMRKLLARIGAVVDAPSRRPASPSTWRSTRISTTLLVEAAGSAVVARQIGRVVALPFASPSGFVLAQARCRRRASC
jgi:DNA-binding GntR family transcriptional regulator